MTAAGGAVLITGANGGIGRALVEVFADAGYTVIGTDLQPASQVAACQHYVSADLRRTVQDETYAATVFAAIRQRLAGQPLRALINNAAVQILGSVGELSRAQWRDTLDANLLAPFFWAQALLAELEAANGCILNISSIHARLTKAEFCAYATSKAALSGLTRAMAIELGAKVRVNAIEPAAIDTPMLRAGFAGNEAGFQQLEHFHPSKRIGAPKQLGALAKMIVETDAAFMNGMIVPFDGGIGACLHDPKTN